MGPFQWKTQDEEKRDLGASNMKAQDKECFMIITPKLI